MPLGAAAAPIAALCIALILPVSAAGGAARCENGDTLVPGQSCELELRWDYDHWLVADFEEDKAAVEFRLAAGTCSVALTGPLRALLGPDQDSLRSTRPGEYHLFLRGISVAEKACIYRVTVE